MEHGTSREKKKRQYCVIGGFIKRPDMRSMICSYLSPLMFQRRDCREAFRILLDLHENGEQIDQVKLAEELDRRDLMPEPCDPAFTVDVVDVCLGQTDLEISIERVVEFATKKRVEEIGQEMTDGSTKEVDKLISDAREKLDRARAEMNTDSGILHISEPMNDLIDSIQSGDFCSIEYPVSDLQDVTCGLQEGQYCVIGARPSVGKTSFARQIVYNAAEKNNKTLFVSAEMSATAIAQCYIQSETGISMQQVRRGFYDEEDEEKINNARERYSNLPIYIDPCKDREIMSIKSRAEVKAKEEGLDLIVVDYLQVISAEADSRVQEVGKITRNLKNLAMTLEIPVVVASQINRKSEGRPKLRHLKWSGAIEQDADQVLLIHREIADEETEGEAEIIVAKNRMGPTASVDVTWLPKKMKFVDRTDLDRI